MKLLILFSFILLIHLSCSKAPPAHPTQKDLQNSLVYVQTTDEKIKEMAPSTQEYIEEHPELKDLVTNNQIKDQKPYEPTQNAQVSPPDAAPASTPDAAPTTETQAQAHQMQQKHDGICGDLVDIVFDVADKLVQATVGDISTCGYGLRTVATYLISKGPLLVKVGQYVSSGVVQRQFFPTILPPLQAGGGLYRKTSGSATGANGVVRFQIGDTNQYLILYFENSWNQWYIGSVCIQNNNNMNSLSKIYNTIYYASTDIMDDELYQVYKYHANDDILCYGSDVRIHNDVSYSGQLFGQQIKFNAGFKYQDFGAQRCKLVSVSAVIG